MEEKRSAMEAAHAASENSFTDNNFPDAIGSGNDVDIDSEVGTSSNDNVVDPDSDVDADDTDSPVGTDSIVNAVDNDYDLDSDSDVDTDGTDNRIGRLYLCATPIGNLEDITFRVLRTLREVDLIAAEDTRGSIKLLNHFDIHTPMTSYHKYNRIEKAHVLIDKMRAGKNVALITDAGTPAISDPGEDLVRLCMEAGIEVTSLPGACACVTALTLSGLPTRRFCFEAFLPTDKKERQQILEELESETRTIILYEAPHRLVRTLAELYETLGDRRATICRELTKKHETVFATTLGAACAWYQANEPRGECVIVIEGRDRREIEREERQQWEELSIPDHLALYVSQGLDRKDAMKAVAKDRGISKREVYAALL